MYDTIIIGGGAAGLFTAANLKVGDNLLLEGSKKLGQKILLTGGGMCNITNMDCPKDFITHFGDKKKLNFLKPALLNLSTKECRNYLESIDLDLVIRNDGKVFPKTLKAQSLINSLQREIAKNKILIKYNSKVVNVENSNNGFTIHTSKSSFKCRNLILATGGQSFPGTGSDGSGFSISKELGHNIISPTPGLTGIKVENYMLKALAGNSIKGSLVEFYRSKENKRHMIKRGDILFTHNGLSGPVILNNSRTIRNNDRIVFSLIPTSNKEELRSILVNSISNSRESLKKTLKKLA